MQTDTNVNSKYNQRLFSGAVEGEETPTFHVKRENNIYLGTKKY